MRHLVDHRFQPEVLVGISDASYWPGVGNVGVDPVLFGLQIGDPIDVSCLGP